MEENTILIKTCTASLKDKDCKVISTLTKVWIACEGYVESFTGKDGKTYEKYIDPSVLATITKSDGTKVEVYPTCQHSWKEFDPASLQKRLIIKYNDGTTASLYRVVKTLPLGSNPMDQAKQELK